MYFEKMFFSRFFCGEKDLFAKFAHAELRPDELLKRVFQIVQPDDGVPIALRQMKLQPQHLFRKRRITVDLFRNRIAEGELLPVRFHLKTELADQMISVTVFRPEEIEIRIPGMVPRSVRAQNRMVAVFPGSAGRSREITATMSPAFRSIRRLRTPQKKPGESAMATRSANFR